MAWCFNGVMAQAVDNLEIARKAAARPTWREAYDAYSSVPNGDLTPEDLERFADAAWWTGKLDEAIGLRERAYAGFADADDTLSAARLALTLSQDHASRGAFAVSHGWFAKADRLLADEPESAEHAYPDAHPRRSTHMFAGGDLAEADRRARPRIRSRPALRRPGHAGACAGREGPSAHQDGEVEQGLALLDEATAAARRGELRPYSDRTRLLHHDQLVPGPRRLPPRGRVDGGGESLVRPARRHRLPRRLPDPPRGDHAPARRLARGRGAGDRGVRGAPRLRPLDHRRRLLRDRRDPPPPRRLRRRGGGVREGQRAGPRRRSPASRSFASPRARSTPRSPAISARSPRSPDPLVRLRGLPAQVEISVAAADLEDRARRGDRARADRRLVQDRRPADARVRRDRPASHAGRITLAEGDAEEPRALRPRAGRLAAGRRAVRDGRGPLLARPRFRRQGDEHAAHVRARSGARRRSSG